MDLSGRQGDFLACVDEERQLLAHDIVDKHDGMITRQCRAKWDLGQEAIRPRGSAGVSMRSTPCGT
jgi:hypothetical protein